MPFEQLSLSSLSELDYGKANEMFQVSLRRAVQDCMDRPGDPKARKVALEFALVPRTEQSGDLVEVSLEVKCKTTVPDYVTKPYPMAIRKGGSLFFNPDSPDNASQTTFNMGGNE